MKVYRIFLTVLICLLVMIIHGSSSNPLCTNMGSPFKPKAPLAFCQYNSSVCCNSTEDLQLQNQFKAMNVSTAGCASVVKSILCSICDPFSGELYQVQSANPRAVPVLCNSTISVNSTQSQPAAVDFCSKVWVECQNVSILNSPFDLQGRNSTTVNSTSKLHDLWHSKTVFCNEFGGASSTNESACFDGRLVLLNKTETLSPPSGVCVEKIDNGTYLNMAAHPDGSNRVFLTSQAGKIWLATVPEDGSQEVLGIHEASPFLDLTDRVIFDTELGLMGIAFHPNFEHNGRFFASFNCDKVKESGCSGRCSCNSEVGCDPAKLVSRTGAPCQYHSVIAEYTANGTASQPSLSTSAKPQEVRRILTMGLPFSSHHGGQILFGPKDGYLYFIMGDGGGKGDPYNFAQNKKSLLGKIMRIDVDNIPSAKTIFDLGLWGNYSIPEDNPFSEDKDLKPEIWALGFRNPWRCSFDSERPSYFLCADVGEDEYEEVDAVTKGGNFGWRVYEGPFLFTPPNSPGGNTSASEIKTIFPVMGYSHSDVNDREGSASITGGFFYRSTTDPCMYGRYLYADLYAGGMWAGTENPQDSGKFTSTKLPLSCAPDSPVPCSADTEDTLASLGFIFSFGQDNRKDIFILASNGLYRVASPSRCNLKCSLENATDRHRPPAPPPSPSLSNSWHRSIPTTKLLLFLACKIAFA